MKIPLLERLNIDRIQLRDAFRLGLQSAAAATVMYGIMDFYSLPEKFVGILSAVLVIEKTIGASWSKSWERFAATLVGSAIGIASLILLPNAYRTLVVLPVSMFVINAVAGIRPQWRYGVVAAVALSLGGEDDMMQAALNRSLAIGIGVVVGSLAALVVWPDSAKSRAQRNLREAWRLIARYLDTSVKNALSSDADDLDEIANKYSTYISDARSCIADVRLTGSEQLKKVASSTERLYNSLIIVSRISESSDHLDGGNSDLKETINKISDICCDTLKTFADEEELDSDPYQTLSDLLDDYESQRDALEDDEDTRSRTTFVFAINEIREALKNLEEARKTD